MGRISRCCNWILNVEYKKSTMKQKKKFFILGLAALFAACSNEIDSVIEPDNSSIETTLNLQSLKYDDLAEVLSKISSSAQKVILEDGSNTCAVNLKRNQKVNVESGGQKIHLFTGQGEDSVYAALSPDYATLRLQKNGESVNYVTYKDNEEMAKVANYYTTQYLPTQSRSINEYVTCIRGSKSRSAESNITCVKLNITKAIKYNPLKVSSEDEHEMNKKMEASLGSEITPYEDLPLPSKLFFMLVKEQDGGSLDHEITWQIESTTTSLDFLINSGFIEPTFIILESSFIDGNEYPNLTFDGFRSYLKKWDDVKGKGDRTYVCMRNGVWEDRGLVLGEVIGIGLIHHYKPVNDFSIYALSTSSSLYPHTLAHEIGHLFGAQHTSIKDDVMLSPHEDTATAHHKSADNWDRMIQCLLEK